MARKIRQIGLKLLAALLARGAACPPRRLAPQPPAADAARPLIRP